MEQGSRTRERLLEVAERLFAEKGYTGATVREITRLARCNVAAINYYFGGKKNLYLEVFRERFLPRAERLKMTFLHLLEEETPGPEGIIRAFARAFLSEAVSREERILSHRLIAREMSEPSEAFHLILEKVFRPFFEELVGLLKPYVPKESLHLAILSIHAQILYFNFNRLVVEELCGESFDKDFLTKLIRHIVLFSLYGLEGQTKHARD